MLICCYDPLKTAALGYISPSKQHLSLFTFAQNIRGKLGGRGGGRVFVCSLPPVKIWEGNNHCTIS